MIEFRIFESLMD